jgi:hypothetical protein
MDVFNNPYWSLEQLHAWALTRDRDLVSMTAPSDDGAPAGQRLDIQIRIAISQQKAFKGGRDIQSELWAKSGMNPEKYAAHAHGIHIGVIDATDNGTSEKASIEITDSCQFPILEYLAHLFRNGKLSASGNQKGEPTATDISIKDWAGLSLKEINERIEIVSNGTGGIAFANVGVRRDEILGEFPDVVPKSSVDLAAVFRAEANQKKGPLTQVEAEKIARDNGANFPREKIREVLRDIQGRGKPGPKGRRKKPAAVSA